MSKPRRRAHTRREALPAGAMIHCCSGLDYFGSGFADYGAMRNAWASHPELRESVAEYQVRRWGCSDSFASDAFGTTGRKRFDPENAPAIRERLWAKQQSAQAGG